MQIVALFTVTVGFGIITTCAVSVFTHPKLFEPETVYVVVTVGFAITVAPLVIFNPDGGSQVYVFAPLAISVTDPAGHMVPLFTVIVGRELTVMEADAEVFEHPFASVTVTE